MQTYTGNPADRNPGKTAVLDQTAGLQGYGSVLDNAPLRSCMGAPQDVKTILGCGECTAYICEVHATPTVHTQCVHEPSVSE